MGTRKKGDEFFCLERFHTNRTRVGFCLVLVEINLLVQWWGKILGKISRIIPPPKTKALPVITPYTKGFHTPNQP